jgi:hypothetical protein
MKQIEKLTQEEEKLMYQFRDEWINFVLQSRNSNNNDDDYDNNLNFLQIYNKIKDDIWWRYEKTRLKNKKPIILIANSYLEEKLMITFVKLSQTLLVQIGELERTQVWEQVREQIRGEVGEQVWRQIIEQVGSQVWGQVVEQIDDQVIEQGLAKVGKQIRGNIIEQLGEQVDKKVRHEVKEQVWDGLWNLVTWQVRKKVWEQVWTQVMDQVEEQIGHIRVQVCWQVENQVRGQVIKQVLKNEKLKFKFVEQHFGLGFEYGLSFYEYFKKIGIIEDEEEFEKYVRPYKIGKIWSIQYFENFVFICRLPKKVNRDSSNSLHSTTEAAVQWHGFDYLPSKRDLHFIHGVYFEREEWEKIVNNKISVIELLKIKNKEKQRAALSIYSIEKLIEELDAKEIDVYKNPRDGNKIILYEINKKKVGLEEDLLYLKYKDPSTGRIYISGIPPFIKKANEAMAWKFRLTVEEYENQIEMET